MLCEKFSNSFYKKYIVKKYKPFPIASEREAWENLSNSKFHDARRNEILTAAEKLLKSPWPQLKASDYMRFIKDGNRILYETPYFMRRNNLGMLVLAECLEHKGRFLDEIINGIWEILGEPVWCVPAHANYIGDLRGDFLPEPGVEIVDLFTGVTGAVLGQTYILLKEELEAVSPALCKRLVKELASRVVEPVENENCPFRWLNNPVNNWSPWCASNVLMTALAVIDDQERLIVLIMKLQNTLDKFISSYKPDGGCNEGPSYWSVAAGSMLLFLETLNSITNDKAISIYEEPLIKNMGSYINTMHITHDWMFSIADCVAKMGGRNAIIYRYGERTGNKAMKELALFAFCSYGAVKSYSPLLDEKCALRVCGDFLTHTIRELFWLPDNFMQSTISKELYSVLPDLQIMVARESEDPENGLVLCIKAGSNAESHNHNDVGQFEIFCDGIPVVIDLGTGEYTRKTFSENRYEIWYLGAEGHNVPQINGQVQREGDYYARDVRFDNSAEASSMTMDITRVYSETVGIKSLVRRAELDSKNGIAAISDTIKIYDDQLRVVLPIYFYLKPQVIDNSLLITLPGGVLRIELENAKVKEIQEIKLKDAKLIKSWGNKIYKVGLCCGSDNGECSYSIKFSKGVSA